MKWREVAPSVQVTALLGSEWFLVRRFKEGDPSDLRSCAVAFGDNRLGQWVEVAPGVWVRRQDINTRTVEVRTRVQ
jgi:hypothetical protein